MPCPSAGNSLAMVASAPAGLTTDGEQIPESLLLVRVAGRQGGAPLGVALLGRHFHPALALAAVLPLAGVVGPFAAALALTGVDARAVDAGVLGGGDQRRGRGEEPGNGGGDQCTFGGHANLLSVVVSAAGAPEEPVDPTCPCRLRRFYACPTNGLRCHQPIRIFRPGSSPRATASSRRRRPAGRSPTGCCGSPCGPLSRPSGQSKRANDLGAWLRRQSPSASPPENRDSAFACRFRPWRQSTRDRPRRRAPGAARPPGVGRPHSSWSTL